MRARSRAWASALAMALLVTWPFLRPPTARFGDDDLEYAIPFAHFVLGELAQGRVPSWNPSSRGWGRSIRGSRSSRCSPTAGR